MKAIWVFVYMELALFAFTSCVSVYNLTIPGPEGAEYRNQQRYHLVVTFILLYLAMDHRRLAKGYVVVFLCVIVLDLLQAIECTLYLSKVNMPAYVLDLISGWANVVSISIITVWYCYVVVKNGDRLKYVHF